MEIVPRREFFDYRAKYDPALSEEVCPARIPNALATEAQDLALRAHRALGCRGLARLCGHLRASKRCVYNFRGK